jgi:CO/xanthine dehydrogenase FAD-binding subunit
MNASPRTLNDAVARLQDDPELIPIAGCTDLMVVGASDTAKRYLDLLQIEELRGIQRAGDTLHIGATTTFREIGASEVVGKQLPILAEVASVVGGWQIQNRATVGGNMVNASPAGDSLPVLLALGATVVLAGASGERRVPYDQFHLDYRKTALRSGELVSRLIVPLPPPGSVQRFRKVGTRAAQSISKVVVALSAHREGRELSQVRLGAGSVAALPVRLTATEERCEGADLGPALADVAATTASSEVQPIDDVRSTAEYRRWVLGRVVRRMILSIEPE